MQFKKIFSKELVSVALFVSILAIIVIPLPKFALDSFLTISLSLSLLILLISLYIQRPSDLTTFPTLLVILVLFRLALNIATTRSILSEGHNGPDAVSSIITAFGDFVVGGNMTIGIIVFIILVLINFMVVTKGATRVAEVKARFSLDSMPGKQMAIDADLNAGFIDDEEAKQRREDLASEVNFYGAMDGSSKFVKGDAVAGIIITLVNLVGGLMIGIFQHDLSAADSAEIYTILTIGDGLVAQIPALVLSTATAIIITRSNKDDDNFAAQSITQLVDESKSLMIVGVILFFFSFIPGFPSGILIIMGVIFMFAGYIVSQTDDFTPGSVMDRLFGKKVTEKKKIPDDLDELKKEKIKANIPDEKTVLDNVMKMEVLELKLGLRLLTLISENNELVDKIKGIRKSIASDLGFVIPQIKISDDSSLGQNEYALHLKRIPIVKGTVQPNKLLAMGGISSAKLPGLKVKEPVFGLDAVWISSDLKDEALRKGFTVVDVPTIISTHISETIQKHSEDILTRQDVVNIVEKLKEDFPVVIEEAMKVTNYGSLLKVCKDLLHEKIPIVDMLTIIEAIADIAEFTKAPDVLLEHVRSKLYRLITERFKSPEDGALHLLTIKSELEQDFIGKLQEMHGVTQLMLSIAEINNLVTKTKELLDQLEIKGVSKPVLVVDPQLRKRISEIYEKFGLALPVLSHAELDAKANFVIEGSLEF